MKVFKKITTQYDWAKAKEDIHTGSIVGILDAGEVVPGDFGDRHVFTISTENGNKSVAFNQTTMNYLIDAFGDETTKWINKSIKVWIERSNIGGKMRNVIYLTHPDWVETEDGFAPPGKVPKIDDEDIPVIEEEPIPDKDIDQ